MLSKTLKATVVVAAATLLAACGGGGDARTGGPAGGTLKVVGPFELHSVDPSTAEGFFTRLQVAETLVEANPAGRLQPGLASRWDAAPGQLEWRFTLAPKAVFHDGTAVTADSVAKALNVARAKEGTPLTDVPIEDVVADGNAVLVKLRSPFAPLPAVLADMSAQILAPASYGADGAVSKVIGSGPYRVEKLQIPQRVDVVAFDRWRGAKPAINRVSYLAVGRSESRALMAESGEAHVTFGMDPVSLQRVRGDADLEINAVTLPRTILLKVNAGHEILGDVRVRRALSMALDRPAMATALLRDPEMAATQLFPPSLPDWHQESVTPLSYDQQAAGELLAGAGWTRGEDNMLSKDGQPFELRLRTYPDRPELPTLATAIQAKLKEIGVALDVQVGNSSEIPAGHEDGTLELGLIARNFSLVPDPVVTLIEDFRPEGSDWGAMGWRNAALTATLRDMADGIEPAAATAGRRQVAEIMQTELPVIPVAWYRQSAVVSRDVEGLVLDPLERSWGLSALSWARS